MELTASLVVGGTEFAVADWSMVVVYERATGRIVHRHQSVTFKGAQPPDRATLERAAIELAAPKSAQAAARWSTLQVDPLTLKEDATYKVDIRKKALVEVKPRKPAKRR
jgi:hypothetical protein